MLCSVFSSVCAYGIFQGGLLMPRIATTYKFLVIREVRKRPGGFKAQQIKKRPQNERWRGLERWGGCYLRINSRGNSRLRLGPVSGLHTASDNTAAFLWGMGLHTIGPITATNVINMLARPGLKSLPMTASCYCSSRDCLTKVGLKSLSSNRLVLRSGPRSTQLDKYKVEIKVAPDNYILRG